MPVSQGKPQEKEASGRSLFVEESCDRDSNAAALAALAAAGWFAPGALCIVETADRTPAVAAPEGFETLDARRYGKARFAFLRFRP